MAQVVNNIAIAEFFDKMVDEGYLANSKTANLFSNGKLDILDNGYGKIHVRKVNTQGIGTYEKNDAASGYANSATTITYEEIEPDFDLSSAIMVDHFENEDALKDNLIIAYADLQDKLVKELDAMRIASIVKQANSERVISETITDGADAVAKIRKALNIMDNKRVYNDKILLATPEILGAIDDMDTYKSTAIKSRFVNTVMMEEDIFQTGIDIGTGRSNDWNYTKAEGAKQINFMIVSKSAVDSITRTRSKYLDSLENYDSAAMKFRVRGLSAYVFDNKKDGIYVSTAV